jgi:hypothetical protein
VLGGKICLVSGRRRGVTCPSFVSKAARDKVSVKLLLLGVAVAVIVFLATSGHVLFLPLVLVLPLGLLFRGGRQRHQRNWNWFGRK